MQSDVRVFLSYAHADTAHLETFLTHFGPVRRGKGLEVWFDRDLSAGEVWSDVIREQIRASDIFVCLVTSAFMNSNYILDTELPAIRQAVAGRGALLVPVIVEKSIWEGEFGPTQCVPTTAKGRLLAAANWRPKRDGFHAAAEQAARAIQRYIETIPPRPATPRPGPSLILTPQGFELADDGPSAAERLDPLQSNLHDLLRERLSRLEALAARSCGNTHPALIEDLADYRRFTEATLAELNVAGLVAAGNALRGMIHQYTPPLAAGVMAEPLEPDVIARAETLLDDHARFVMGFSEGRELVLRHGTFKAAMDRPAEARREALDVFRPLLSTPGLLAGKARTLAAMMERGLQQSEIVAKDSLGEAIHTGGRFLAGIGRGVGRRIGGIGGIGGAVGIASFLPPLAGDPNFSAYRAALSFFHENSGQLLAFAAHQDEIRRLMQWVLEQLGTRKRPQLALADDGEPETAEERPAPEEFDLAVVHEMILRGEAPPASWVPMIRALNFTFHKDLETLDQLSGLTALQFLDCSDTGVTDLAPLSGLFALQSLTCSHTGVTDLAPLSGLSALQNLYCFGTGVTDLAPLSGLSALQSLYFSDEGVTDLTPLSGLSALRTLYCLGTGVTDLAPLSRLSALQTLDFSLTSVTDLAPLSGLFALQSLSCARTSVIDLAPLAGLSALQTLDFSYTSVTDLAPLSGLPALQSLNCSETGIVDLAPISGLSALQRLYCSRTRVTDLAPLSGLRELATLDISDTAVVDWTPLQYLSSLQTIGLANLPLPTSRPHLPVGTKAVTLLGSAWPEGVPHPTVPYRIDPDGTIHDPDGNGGWPFNDWVHIASRQKDAATEGDATH